MLELGTNIYGNFKPRAPINSEVNVRALVIGKCGAGQTTFLNNMCNTKHRFGIAKGGVTRQMIYEDVVHIKQNKFRLYDTPAFSYLEHGLILRACLTNLPYNLILIQTRYDDCYQRSLQQLIELTKILNGYESNIVYLLSCGDWIDHYENKSEILAYLGQSLQEFNLNKHKIILYSNKNSDIPKLANILYDIAKSNTPQKIQISQNTFYKYFRQYNQCNLNLPYNLSQYREQIQERYQIFMDFTKSLKPTTSDLEEIVSEMKIFMKHHMKKLQHQQYQEYSKNRLNEIAVNCFLMISRVLQKNFQQLDQICDRKIRKIIYDDDGKKIFDIRDMIKKCPVCGQIWMRVGGSEGTTYCGDRPNSYDYIRNRDVYSYIFQIKNDKLTYTKKKLNNVTENMVKSNQKEKKQKLSNQTNQKQVGCGAMMNWKKLPRIQNIEELAKQLYSVSNFEEIKLELDQIYKTNVQYKEKMDKAVKKTYDVMKNDNLQLLPQEKCQKIKEPEHKLYHALEMNKLSW